MKKEDILKICKYEDLSTEELTELTWMANAHLYKERPVTINEFISSTDFVAKKWPTIFPIWKDVLNEMYPTPFATPYNEILISAAAGAGKTVTATIGNLYDMYKLGCLKDPCSFYGLSPGTMLIFAIFSATGTTVAVNWQDITTGIEMCPWLNEKVVDRRGLEKKNGSLVFTQMTVRAVTPNANKQITQIHRYCVYEAFEKMGWLYVPYMPEQPGPHPSIKESIYILTKKLDSTHNDQEQELFSAMKDMLTYIDESTSEKQYFFGTDFFERVWEKMVDKAFGIENKDEYFPRTRWLLDYGRDKEKTPLIPDTIMVFNDKVYVLDAKLYRYGFSGVSDHLPNGTDINKQITYGEYIERIKHTPDDSLYNAFIMPFDKENNPFWTMGADGNPIPCVTTDIGNVGEAVGDWKVNMKNYERIQGIVMDTRFLMYNYISMSDQQKQELASCIEKVRSRGPVPAPRTT